MAPIGLKWVNNQIECYIVKVCVLFYLFQDGDILSTHDVSVIEEAMLLARWNNYSLVFCLDFFCCSWPLNQRGLYFQELEVTFFWKANWGKASFKTKTLRAWAFRLFFTWIIRLEINKQSSFQHLSNLSQTVSNFSLHLPSKFLNRIFFYKSRWSGLSPAKKNASNRNKVFSGEN